MMGCNDVARRIVETWRAASLPSSLPPIALPTQHLAILGDGATALFPWGDVVGLHLLYIEWLAKHYSTTLELFLPIFTT